jgi:hypothetical protein
MELKRAFTCGTHVVMEQTSHNQGPTCWRVVCATCESGGSVKYQHRRAAMASTVRERLQFLIKSGRGKPLQSFDRITSYAAVARGLMQTNECRPFSVWQHNTITGMQRYDSERTRRLSAAVVSQLAIA